MYNATVQRGRDNKNEDHGHHKILMEMLDGMRKRLKRRNILLDEVRNAYLSDVLVASNKDSLKRAPSINFLLRVARRRDLARPRVRALTRTHTEKVFNILRREELGEPSYLRE